MTFWDKASKFPPILVRLLARHKPNGKPLTNHDLARRMDTTPLKVASISEQVDWDGVDIRTMRLFLVACGLDFEDPRAMKRATVYMRGHTKKGVRVPPRFSYLQNHPLWETEFKPLAEKFFRHAIQTTTAVSS